MRRSMKAGHQLSLALLLLLGTACGSTIGSADAGGTGGAAGGTGGHLEGSGGQGGIDNAQGGAGGNAAHGGAGGTAGSGGQASGGASGRGGQGAIGAGGEPGQISCGNGQYCFVGEVCVHPSCGGGVAVCTALPDGGQCPSGWTYSTLCATGGRPGCTPPPCTPPNSFCATLP
jgi:hypothetical protein